MTEEKKIITVYHGGDALALYETVAKRFNISDGYKIKSTEQLYKLIAANADYIIQSGDAQIQKMKNTMSNQVEKWGEQLSTEEAFIKGFFFATQACEILSDEACRLLSWRIGTDQWVKHKEFIETFVMAEFWRKYAEQRILFTVLSSKTMLVHKGAPEVYSEEEQLATFKDAIAVTRKPTYNEAEILFKTIRPGIVCARLNDAKTENLS